MIPWGSMCKQLAQRRIASASDVYEYFTERAAIREYLGGADRAEAERLAWGETLRRFGE